MRPSLPVASFRHLVRHRAALIVLFLITDAVYVFTRYAAAREYLLIHRIRHFVSYRNLVGANEPSDAPMQRCALILVMSIVRLAQPISTAAQDLPDGDLFGEQEFSPTLEIMLAAGNGLLAGYNGIMYARGMRRDFVAGLSVITGSIGLAIGLREGANYPEVDVVTGVAAILAGGAQLLLKQSGFPLLRVENSAVVAKPILVSVSGEPASRIGLSVRLVHR